MASPLIIATFAAVISGFRAPEADLQGYYRLVVNDCSAAVSQVLCETGGQLLSVYPSGDGQSCLVTVLVQGNGERPRKVTIRLPM